MKLLRDTNTIIFLSLWTLLIAIAAFLLLQKNKEEMLERARIEARTLFEINLVYRRWFALQGGVYVPIRDDFKPNPYLLAPNRDIEDSTGRRLTLVNPAWMTRMVFELLQKQSDLAPRNRITSEKYLNPANKPDEWEGKVLRSFAAQETNEVSHITEIDGRPYLRLMKPMYTEQGCLKCHGHQGYKVGDIRGGIGISVNLEPFYETLQRQNKHDKIVFFALWLAGASTILFLNARIIRQNRERLLMQRMRHTSMRNLIVAIMHNWRQPLNRVAVAIQSIEDSFENNDLSRARLRENVAYAMEQLKQVSGTVDYFRDVISPDEGISDFYPEEVIAESLAHLKDYIVYSKARLSFVSHGVSYDPINTANRAFNFKLRSYKSAFKRVVEVCLINSFESLIEKVRVAGGANTDGFVEILFSRDGKSMCIRITDNGIGIPAGLGDRIFDPYFTTKEPSQFQGMGLYIAKTITENVLKGTIQIEQPHKGVSSVFVIRLPDIKE